MNVLSKAHLSIRRPARIRIFDLVLWVCVGIVTVPSARADVATPDAPVAVTAAGK
ncbi:MAG: hypothetical protein IT438_14280 [Phycisphaerales bacterium]|nr:hypothetical protein [Phycisphaerales bacterium]